MPCGLGLDLWDMHLLQYILVCCELFLFFCKIDRYYRLIFFSFVFCIYLALEYMQIKQSFLSAS